MQASNVLSVADTPTPAHQHALPRPLTLLLIHRHPVPKLMLVLYRSHIHGRVSIVCIGCQTLAYMDYTCTYHSSPDEDESVKVGVGLRFLLVVPSSTDATTSLSVRFLLMLLV